MKSNITEREPVDPDITGLSRRLYKIVQPTKKDTQTELSQYHPKPFGEKRTYPQDWYHYEKACSQEKLMFLKILKDATDYMMIDYKYKGNGRPPAYYGDIIKSLCIRLYSNYSSWRSESELKIARSMGIIDEVHKRSTLNKYLKDPHITELLHKLYKIIAQPLAEIEIYFAVDASGISNAYGNDSWRKLKYTTKDLKKRRQFSKLHISSGCKTNIIASAKITQSNVHDTLLFRTLVGETADIFSVKEVLADAGYISKKNVLAVSKIGAEPYIMPKKNTPITKFGRKTSWNKMLMLWKENRMLFAQHYHQRSNVESTFGAFKRKFGDSCRSKLPVSQENEILCKIVCFNASVLSKALLQNDLRGGFIATL